MTTQKGLSAGNTIEHHVARNEMEMALASFERHGVAKANMHQAERTRSTACKRAMRDYLRRDYLRRDTQR
jgi:hypothetical protein